MDQRNVTAGHGRFTTDLSTVLGEEAEALAAGRADPPVVADDQCVSAEDGLR